MFLFGLVYLIEVRKENGGQEEEDVHVHPSGLSGWNRVLLCEEEEQQGPS